MARIAKEIAIVDIEIPKSRVKRVDLETEGGGALLESVKCQGILHPPLVQPPKETGGKYRLVFGQRRLACAKKLSLETIRVTVDESMSDEEAEYAVLAENLFRSSAKSPTEYRKAIRRWWEIHSKALEEAGKTDRQASPQGAGVHGNKWRDDLEKSTSERRSEVDSGDETEAEPKDHCQAEPEVAESAPAEAVAKPSTLSTADRTFSKKLQDATGYTDRKARHDAAIAKAFTEEQLTVIDALELTEEQIRALATVKDEKERNAAIGLMSSGEEPGVAIENAKKVAKECRKKKEVDDLSDGEWLDQYCGDVRKKLGTNLKAFDTSAILYRGSVAGLKVLKATISHPIRNARLQKANDPLTLLLGKACMLNHPMQWNICGMCNGTGHDANGEKCNGCYCGCGFSMTYGNLKK